MIVLEEIMWKFSLELSRCSLMLTDSVSAYGLLIVVISSTFLKRKDMLKEKLVHSCGGKMVSSSGGKRVQKCRLCLTPVYDETYSTLIPLKNWHGELTRPFVVRVDFEHNKRFGRMKMLTPDFLKLSFNAFNSLDPKKSSPR